MPRFACWCQNAGTCGSMEPALAYGRWRLARSEVRVQTFLHYGKQVVNPLAGQADFPQLRLERQPVGGLLGRAADARLQTKLVDATNCTQPIRRPISATSAALRCRPWI